MNGYVHNEMGTYGFGVDPTDLRLKLCEPHKQNYVVFPLVARLSRCSGFCHKRSGRNVGPDITQRFELVFWALSTFYEVSGEAKHSTWFCVLPIGGDQRPRVFDDSRGGVSCRGTHGCYGEAMSDLSIL